MKFSIATLTTAFLAFTQAGVVSYNDGKGKNDKDIETFKGKFALAVREFNDGHKGKGKGNKDHDLDLIGDGQLEYGGRKDQVYDPFNDGHDGKNQHGHDGKNQQHGHDNNNHKSGGNQNWKRGDENNNNNNNEKFEEIKFNKDYFFFTLRNERLSDEKHHIGEIVSNHQFQFDDKSQPGSINNGFTIVYEDGEYLLALKGQTKFWNSKVDGNGVYKIYDAPITDKSRPIELIVLKVDEDNNKNGQKW
ncbi:LOW QUALITY PROTEIN: hypothetical protein SBY92_001323 [Candida maltosa Xu316]